MNIVIKTTSFQGDAADVFEAVKAQPYPFSLDSSLPHPSRGRYSILGCDPFEVVRSDQNNILDVLDQKFRNFSGESFSSSGLPFEGGVVGALSYDYGLPLQKIASRHVRSGQPYGVFGFYDTAVVIDHQRAELHVVSTGLPERNSLLRQARAEQRAQWMMEFVKNIFVETGLKPVSTDFSTKTFKDDKRKFGTRPLHSNMTKEQYLSMVRRAQDLISSGEIYQVNLSQRFACPWPGGRQGWSDLYRSLRKVSPSSFSACFDAGDFALISSSPERFLWSDGKNIQTVPMKGTRRRGQSPGDDKKLKQELLDSDKDRAELLMITDLMRSDLGRVCQYGTVRVTEPRQMEEYATVYQTTSTVEGVLNPGVSPFEILKAAFPGGSITGCPKIRSMQVIDELEPDGRGFYTGALGYAGFNGRMDFNMLIRTIIAERRQLTFSAGGGIVADSDPEKEYEETLVKAEGMRRAIQKIQEIDARTA